MFRAFVKPKASACSALSPPLQNHRLHYLTFEFLPAHSALIFLSTRNSARKQNPETTSSSGLLWPNPKPLFQLVSVQHFLVEASFVAVEAVVLGGPR